ncbi:hypothetical protein M378DRAFT_9504 [Amanita muscaria Koide BX008]|uniref:Uncharacterized protein n=1 Tax=Amanita muscaria (strain Koide BX008) TaxID=946122 RepID=A0A0C2XCU7_AMAMK|nr:hypothetical protein M378DRAFT_9504 [Amanita muscaria Koide BX008]
MGTGATKKRREDAKARRQQASQSVPESPETQNDLAPFSVPKRGRGRPRKNPADALPVPHVIPRRTSRSVNVTPSTSSRVSLDLSESGDKLPIETIISNIQSGSQCAGDDGDSSGDSVEVDGFIDVDDGSDSDMSMLVVSKKPERKANASKKQQKPAARKGKVTETAEDEPKAFDIRIRINNLSNGTCTPDTVHSTSTWEDLQELLLMTFNVHLSNLHAQYRLSTEKKDTLLCDLTSQRQLETLIEFIRPKRGNSKQVIVDLYNKCDVQAEASQTAMSQGAKRTKGTGKQKASPGAPLSISQSAGSTSFEKRTEIRQSLIELHSCPVHSHPDKKAVCWKDMAQGLCYPVTESNLNLWATLHLENPENYPLTEKPAEIKVQLNGPRTRAPAAKAAASLGGNPMLAYGGYAPPMPMPYGYSPYLYPTPPMPQPPTVQAEGITTGAVEAESYEYPSIVEWLNHCDQHPQRCNRNLGRYAPAFDDEGFVSIDQLVGPRISIEKLAEWLKLGRGTADLIIRYAEQDILLIKASKFHLHA